MTTTRTGDMLRIFPSMGPVAFRLFLSRLQNVEAPSGNPPEYGVFTRGGRVG